jgi:WD40 repeat protein
VTCGKDDTAKDWDLATRETKATTALQAEHVYTLDLSHDDKTLLTGPNSATVVLWDVDTGVQIRAVQRNAGWVEVCGTHPTGH